MEMSENKQKLAVVTGGAGFIGSHLADELIAQDVGMMLQKDPAGFAAKYLQDVPVTQRAVVMAAIKQKLATAAPYTTAGATSAAQNGE